MQKKQRKISCEEAIYRLASQCSLSEQCLQSCKQKLEKWNISEEDSKKILDRLQAEKYVDERRFAAFFVKDKYNLEHWGKKKIELYLRQKNIPQNYIEEALGTIEDENYEDQLYQLISQKIKSTKAKSKYDLKGKLFRFAISRGFESGLSLKTIDKVIQNSNIKFSTEDDEFEPFEY